MSLSIIWGLLSLASFGLQAAACGIMLFSPERDVFGFTRTTINGRAMGIGAPGEGQTIGI